VSDERQDIGLGDELRGLPVFEHGAHYWSELERRLSVENAHGQAPKSLRRWPYLAAAVVAMAAAVAFSLAGFPGIRQSTPQAATAAVVLRAMNAGMASARTFSADVTLTVIVKPGGTAVVQGKLAATAHGDSLVDMTVVSDTAHGQAYPFAGRNIAAYDAETHTATSISIDPAGRTTYRTLTDPIYDLPPGGNLLIDYRLDAAALRGLLAENESGIAIENTMYDGRSAWRASIVGHGTDVDRNGNDIAAMYSTKIVVDRQTGFILRERYTEMLANGQVPVDNELTLTNVRVNAPLAAAAFSPLKPANAQPDRYPGPLTVVRVVRLADAKKLLGFSPLVPRVLPAGYQLETVAIQSTRVSDQPMRRSLLLGYRREGFDRFVIKLYNFGENAGLGVPGPGPVFLDEAPLIGGSLSGNVAQTYFGFPSVGARLEVLTAGGLHLEISGDLSRQEMLSLAGSLATYAH
jgi:outer membrane lipoprotein-sorting protein